MSRLVCPEELGNLRVKAGELEKKQKAICQCLEKSGLPLIGGNRYTLRPDE